MLTLLIRTKTHMPTFVGSSVIVIKLKIKENVRMIAVLCHGLK
jgi:hypothetical protein